MKTNGIENNLQIHRYSLCYVGIRESDIYPNNGFFVDNICPFSSKNEIDCFPIRLNHNIHKNELSCFYNSQLEKIINKTKKSTTEEGEDIRSEDYRFVFYNPLVAYDYSPDIINRSLFLNSQDLLVFLNNKLLVRKWLISQDIPTLSYETFSGKDILYSTLASHFHNKDTFIVQHCCGSGGIGTFLLNQSNFAEVVKQLHELQIYIVSPYLKHGISVNTHVFVSENGSIITPGSVQIINLYQNQLCYHGADFIAYQSIPDSVKEKIKYISLQIADLLCQKSYRGIAGLDFMVDEDGQVYCLEINPRFQASSVIINRYMNECEKSPDEAQSIYELNEMAFANNLCSQICYEDKINYSCYYYFSNKMELSHVAEKFRLLKSCSNIVVNADGLEEYLYDKKCHDDSYLFQAIFPHAICEISPDITLWLNDNIPIVQKPTNILDIKIALLNQGTRIANDFGDAKTGVFESVDIEIYTSKSDRESICMNCAYQIHLSHISPFEIVKIDNQEQLLYYGEKLFNISVERNRLENFSSREQKMLYLATDRLRINMLSGCENKNVGKGCRFCNIPLSTEHFSVDDIYQALLKLQKEAIEFRHIMIGGGSSLSTQTWEDIILLCKKIKETDFSKTKPISLMSAIPPIDIMIELKNSGVEEVAFNLEIANDELAFMLMPNKRIHGKEAYYESFRSAVQIFGIGNVRSSLIVGLDKESDIYGEVIALAGLGVIPCLSAFRALPGSNYANKLGPSNHYLHTVYLTVEGCLKNTQNKISEIGPVCIACRNNMLAI